MRLGSNDEASSASGNNGWRNVLEPARRWQAGRVNASFAVANAAAAAYT